MPVYRIWIAHQAYEELVVEPFIPRTRVATLYGNATIPNADRPSSQDHPLLRRYEGSFIVGYEQQAFAEFSLPLSKLEPVPNKKDNHNNQYLEPKQKKDLEGRVTRRVYLLPMGRSPLEVVRNYQQEIQSKGGRVLFECKAGDGGGEPFRSSSGGGGQMSLAMYLYPEERVKDPSYTNGNCAVMQDIVDQRFRERAHSFRQCVRYGSNLLAQR